MLKTFILKMNYLLNKNMIDKNYNESNKPFH